MTSQIFFKKLSPSLSAEREEWIERAFHISPLDRDGEEWLLLSKSGRVARRRIFDLLCVPEPYDEKKDVFLSAPTDAASFYVIVASWGRLKPRGIASISRNNVAPEA